MYSKQQSRYYSIVSCCLTLLFCSLASAQDHPRSGTADIPFDFYVSGTKMLAGQYTLDIVAPTYVTLRSQDGKQQQQLYFIQTAAPGKNTVAKIIFNLRDGKYYFSQVWSWFGKAQLTSFTPKATDQTKDVALKPLEKDVAKPAGSL
ncbi:MAG: hypothetical protein WA655_06635 [Candidatus Korobacteraceae bacterium]